MDPHPRSAGDTTGARWNLVPRGPSPTGRPGNKSSPVQPPTSRPGRNHRHRRPSDTGPTDTTRRQGHPGRSGSRATTTRETDWASPARASGSAPGPGRPTAARVRLRSGRSRAAALGEVERAVPTGAQTCDPVSGPDENARRGLGRKRGRRRAAAVRWSRHPGRRCSRGAAGSCAGPTRTAAFRAWCRPRGCSSRPSGEHAGRRQGSERAHSAPYGVRRAASRPGGAVTTRTCARGPRPGADAGSRSPSAGGDPKPRAPNPRSRRRHARAVRPVAPVHSVGRCDGAGGVRPRRPRRRPA